MQTKILTAHLKFCFLIMISCFFIINASSQSVFTQWTYEPLQGVATSPSPNLGSGNSTTVGSFTGATTATGSIAGCVQETGTAWQIGTANPGSTNESSGIEFKTSTIGFENITFRYDHRCSNTSTRTARIQYTLNGTSWINYDLTAMNYTNSCANRGGIDLARIDVASPVGNNASDSWSRRNIDFSSIVGAKDNPNFGVRVLAAHYSSTGQFRQANNVSTVATAGTWRIDNVTFSGTQIQSQNPIVSLSVNPSSGSESGTSVFTITANTDIAVSGNKTVDVLISGTGITAGDYTLSNTTISIPNGSSSGMAAMTIVDDNSIEGLETATIALINPSSGLSLGNPSTQNVTITDNDFPPLPMVNLSLNMNVGSEANTTMVTLTATTNMPVSGNQTVSVQLTGSGITSGDYYLTTNTINIPANSTTGSIKLTIADDALLEGTEVANISIGSPSSGIQLGGQITQMLTIINNNCSMLTLAGSIASANGAEISAFDPGSNRLYVVAGNLIEYYFLNNSGVPSLGGNISAGFTPPNNTTPIPNSVAIKNGLLAVAYAIRNNATNAQEPGRVSFYHAANGSFIKDVIVGYLPDMVTFSPDGTRVLTANEGEPNSYGQGDSFDPEGSVSIINISNGILNPSTVQQAGFSSFNGQINALKAAGVRIYGPGATVAQDIEPEYISFSNDGLSAMVTLQENSALAKIDIASATVTNIFPLGLKNHNLVGNGMDASDRDSTSSLGKIKIQNWPVYGMFEPDAIASYSVNGQTYYITANEGDSRAYTGYTEEVRVGAATYILDPITFPNASTLKLNANLGRLQLTNANGDLDNDGDIDRINAFGARSFSIWDQNGILIYDSGDQLEQITALQTPTLFNSEGSSSNFDTRSDNKGPEPEGVVIGKIGGVPFAFIGMERTGDILVFNVSNPSAPVFMQYINTPGDRAVEGLTFVPADQSPTGNALLISSAEVSLTVTIYQVGLNVQTYFVDSDNDGFGDPNSSPIVTCSEVPNGYVNNFSDCDDSNSSEFPGQTWYIDADGDNFTGSTIQACEQPVNGYLAGTTSDCNDNNPSIHPGAFELCNAIDDDCDGTIDEGAPCPPPTPVCGNIITVYVNAQDKVYEGAGANDVYLVDAIDLDAGSSSYGLPSLTRQVKRTLTNIAFNWTTSGACVDATPNGIYNNNDKGLVFKNCLPVSPADFNKVRNFDMLLTDQFGAASCSGRYYVIYGNPQGNKLPEDSEVNLSALELRSEKADGSSEFILYPNPGLDHVDLQFIGTSDRRILHVQDALGRVILSRDFSGMAGNEFSVDTSVFPAGSYTFILSANDFISAKKWVKL